ncbi:MAG: hypothetical protein U1E27_14630 [Kiritimatiellia bacterium]|nr:hypothetical protein [Kiritimatiellia bacterium]
MSTPTAPGRCLVFAGTMATTLFSLAVSGVAADGLRVGLTRPAGVARNPEFVKYDRSAAYFREQGIALRLMDLEDFEHRNLSPEAWVAKLSDFQVVVLQTEPEGIRRFTEVDAARAARVGEALRVYVEGGGGLLLQISSVRYLGGDDLTYWNAVMKPLNVRILAEALFDPSQTTGSVFTKPEGSHGRGENQFFYTQNIRPHEVTLGVSGLWLPLMSFAPMAGTPAMDYGTEWTPVVCGGPKAKSFSMKPGAGFHEIDLQSPGTYAEEPPLVAVRTLGRGRIATLPVDSVFTGRNYGNPFWLDIVESGDPVTGKRSDLMKLQSQLFHWLADSSPDTRRAGTVSRAEFPPFVEWRPISEPQPSKSYAGILGARSQHGGGESSAAEMIAAAKAAGLSFIVFNDPLENLTPEKLEALKADCRTGSDASFYACPGVEFTDGSGIRWALWGEKVVWPRSSFSRDYGGNMGVVTYPQWDGKTVRHFGAYASACGFSPAAVVDYPGLRAAGVIPENLWYFFNLFPRVYEGDRLALDQADELGAALRDLRYVVPMSYTRIRKASEVAASARAAVTRIGGAFENVERMLNSRTSAQFNLAAEQCATVSYDSATELQWHVSNRQMESHFVHTRGAQRVIVTLRADNPAGLREVRVRDADQGVIRRFRATEGATRLSQSFELIHDRQHWLTLEVEDSTGGITISSPVLLFCYKQGLFRCSDNLNTLGPLGFVIHPDRNESLPLVQYFRNAEQYSIQGWDRAGPDLPTPSGRRSDSIFTAETAVDWPSGYPQAENIMLGRRMKIDLAGHDLQIIRMHKDTLVERFDNGKRPGPAMASPPRRVAENEYFETEETLVAPRDRMDHYLAWNHRRYFQSLETWNGSFMWHEGQIRVKKDLTLNRHGGIALGGVHFPFDLQRGVGTMFLAREPEQGIVSDALVADRQTRRRQGEVEAGGFFGQMNSVVGYIGIFPAAGSERIAYRSVLPGRLEFGLGKSGEVVRAGTVLKYAFLAGTIPDSAPSGVRMEQIAQGFNLAGGTNGYPVEIKTGSLESAVFMFTIHAVAQEASFRLGPQKGLGIDLPIRVRDLQDNGCAAVYSTARPWFHFVPVLDGTAWFQEPIDDANSIWAGNVFVCDHPEIRMTLVADGLGKDEAPFLEIHNPTAESLEVELHSPAGTPLFGGTSFRVRIPAGDSVRHDLPMSRYP